MKLSDLRPAPGAVRRRKRVGRGPGSGHGKTSTKGNKGHNARSGGGKAGSIRDIIGGAIGKPAKEGEDQLSIEEIIGGKATEGSETPPAPPAEEQAATPDIAAEQPVPEVQQPDQQPAEAEQPAEESGTLGKLFNQLLQ